MARLMAGVSTICGTGEVSQQAHDIGLGRWNPVNECDARVRLPGFIEPGSCLNAHGGNEVLTAWVSMR